MGAAERTPQITHTERRERSEGGEKEQEVEEAVAMEMVVILDMLRWRFVLPQRTGYRERYTNTNRTMCG